VVLGVFLLLVALGNSGDPAPPAPAAEASVPADKTAAQTAPSTTSTTPAPTPSTTPSTPAPAPVDAVTVTRVIDGDTFEVEGGRTIRVLGIDSCEANTYGGRLATGSAQSALANPYNQPVTLTAEPGVDTDRYGRELRYVQLDGHDFGSAMVRGTHTAVYAGDNDASPAYVSDLRAMDANGRDCDGPTPTTTTPDTDVYVVPDGGGDDDDSHRCRNTLGRFTRC